MWFIFGLLLGGVCVVIATIFYFYPKVRILNEQKADLLAELSDSGIEMIDLEAEISSLESELAELDQENTYLQTVSSEDPVTGVMSPSVFGQIVVSLAASVCRPEDDKRLPPPVYGLSVLMLDFSYCHNDGTSNNISRVNDDCLKLIVKALQQTLRRSDVLGRSKNGGLVIAALGEPDRIKDLMEVTYGVIRSAELGVLSVRPIVSIGGATAYGPVAAETIMEEARDSLAKTKASGDNLPVCRLVESTLSSETLGAKVV